MNGHILLSPGGGNRKLILVGASRYLVYQRAQCVPVRWCWGAHHDLDFMQGPIPLADAAVALIGVDVAAARRAQAQITVERRLYDIGSILSSVGLIEKSYLGKRCAASPRHQLAY